MTLNRSPKKTKNRRGEEAASIIVREKWNYKFAKNSLPRKVDEEWRHPVVKSEKNIRKEHLKLVCNHE